MLRDKEASQSPELEEVSMILGQICAPLFCRHVRIASRKQNEIDKHWQFFLEHPLFGSKFREFVEGNPDMADEAKTYLIKR